MATKDKLAKIVVDLPNHWATGGEGMWARPLGEDLYELRNVPFYAYDLNHLDVVSATSVSPDLKPVARSVVRRSGHRTLRLFVDQTRAEDAALVFLRSLSSLGGNLRACDDEILRARY